MANAFGKIIANVERLHALMDEEGFSAIVARSGKNFTYLSGFATWSSPTRRGRCCWSGPGRASQRWY